MIVKKLEQTLKGGFNGLYAEVVTEDVYRLRTIDFTPDIIFDLGANVGVFTRYARTLFPDAIIISVEPNEENFAHLKKFTSDNNTIFINKAIGRGNIHHATTAANGSGECYFSEGLGYYPDQIMGAGNLEKSFVQSIMPDELINIYLKPGMKSLLKLDIEGAENIIWQDTSSMKALMQMDYICAELHFYAHIGGATHDEVLKVTHHALKSFESTHDCILEHIHFYATKKK